MKPTGLFLKPRLIRTVSTVVIAAVLAVAAYLTLEDLGKIRQAAEQCDTAAQFRQQRPNTTL